MLSRRSLLFATAAVAVGCGDGAGSETDPAAPDGPHLVLMEWINGANDVIEMTPPFSPSVTRYDVDTPEVDVRLLVESPMEQRVGIDGREADSHRILTAYTLDEYGLDPTVEVRVEDDSGATTTYEITLHMYVRPPPTLTEIEVTGDAGVLPLSPAFDPATTSYEVTADSDNVSLILEASDYPSLDDTIFIDGIDEETTRISTGVMKPADSSESTLTIEVVDLRGQQTDYALTIHFP